MSVRVDRSADVLARLETTQIYTRVSIDKLTEVRARTQPFSRHT